MLTISSSGLRTVAATLLMTTAGAFAFANVAVVTSTIDTSPALLTGSVGETSTAEQAGLFMPEPPQSLTETTARPVFFADRKPIVPKQAAEQPQQVQDLSAGSLQLLGTVRLGKGKVKALIRTADAASGKWIPVGEEIDGWKVREVSGDKAVVEANGKRVELKLSYAAHGGGQSGSEMAQPGAFAPPPPPPPQ